MTIIDKRDQAHAELDRVLTESTTVHGRLCPGQASAVGATPMPKSHFFDMNTGKDLKGTMDGKRHNCM